MKNKELWKSSANHYKIETNINIIYICYTDNRKMRTIPNPPEFRQNVGKQLLKICPTLSQLAAENMERSIYNYSLQEAGERNIVKKWDNPFFVQMYVDRLRAFYINLKESPELQQRLLSREIKPQDVGNLTHQDMAPAKWQKLIEEKKIRDENKYTPKLEASTDNFTCRKCKSKKCSYYQLQTRSADEPMTTFVTCLDCGSRWKC